MKLLSLLFGLSLFSTSVLSHPLDLPFTLAQDEIETLERRQGGRVITRGASGKTLPRLEIRTMETQKPDQFTLLLLSMQKFMARSQNDVTSYYQISGIHGVPRQDWNGVKQCSSCHDQGGLPDGYCTHDSVLFPAWHRAYLALFEQEFISIAKGIANSYPQSSRARMQTAADTIRLPYWDWAAAIGGNNLPDSISSSRIVVNTPTGQKTIDNPLYSYHFTDPSKLVYGSFTKWQNTVRYPTSASPGATSNEGAAVSAFNRIRGSLQDQLYRLLTGCKDYLHFSNDALRSSSSGCANSLEGLHNTVHTTAGGVPKQGLAAGHMYYLSSAAFDPLFWFHHCNVDRIFALWQTLHPDSYGASQVQPHSTWTVPGGSTQDANSPLEPFYRSGNSFWTTNSVKDWKVFHYTYPEYANGDGSRAAIAKAVNSLYGRGRASSKKRGILDLPEGAIAQNGSVFEYVANIQAPRYALDGTYLVYLFLGSPSSEDPESWIDDDNLVGPMGVLSQPGMKGKGVLISGSIPLTRSLTGKLSAGKLAHLTEAEVGPFLENLLQWRILGPDGKAVDPDSVPNFLVSVYSTTATNPDSEDEIPEFSGLIPLPIATKGKKGGLLDLDQLKQIEELISGGGS